MLETIDFALKIAFFVLTFLWAGKILIFRSDKQIVINPIVMLIAAILAILPPSSSTEKIAFFVLTFLWAGKILIFRSDKQIVINPIVMLIAAILAILPPSSSTELIFGFEVIKVRIQS